MENDRRQLIDNIRIAIEQVIDETKILSTAADLIDNYSADYNWTGFYMMKDKVLEVGPYIGQTTDLTAIKLDEGICGAAATSLKSIIVDDCRNDSRFLVCSLTTRSEIVVPLVDGDTCLGEIDIDSDKPSNFTQADQAMLEEVANIIVERLKKTKSAGK